MFRGTCGPFKDTPNKKVRPTSIGDIGPHKDQAVSADFSPTNINLSANKKIIRLKNN